LLRWNKLAFKDVFRHAVLYEIITVEESERWIQYRDNQNTTAHDYGAELAEKTLEILSQFIKDASRLCESIVLQESPKHVDS
jgi:hypothetical protein